MTDSFTALWLTCKYCGRAYSLDGMTTECRGCGHSVQLFEYAKPIPAPVYRPGGISGFLCDIFDTIRDAMTYIWEG